MSLTLVTPQQLTNDAEDKPQTPAIGDGLRLYLGCNQRPRIGYVNVDIEPFPGVDVVTDLEKRWPWADGTVAEISCVDLPEHIRQWWERPDKKYLDEAMEHAKLGNAEAAVGLLVMAIENPVRTYGIIHFVNESWRVLKTGGILDAMIPSTEVAGNGAWQDPTHVSYWNVNTWRYFCDVPGNYRHLYPHLIKAKFVPIEIKTFMPNIEGVTYVHAVLRKVE